MVGWEDRTKSPRVPERGDENQRAPREALCCPPAPRLNRALTVIPPLTLLWLLAAQMGSVFLPEPHRRQGPKQGFSTSVSQPFLEAWPPPPRGAEEGTQAQSTDTKKEPGCPLQLSPDLTALHSPPCRALPPPLSKARTGPCATRLPVPRLFACTIFLHLPTCTSLPDPPPGPHPQVQV